MGLHSNLGREEIEEQPVSMIRQEACASVERLRPLFSILQRFSLDLGRLPSAGALGRARISAPSSRSGRRVQSPATRGVLVLNGDGGARRAGPRYVAAKSDEVWMRYVAIRDVHVDIVARIARPGSSLEDQVPRTVEGRLR
jgi:hypothetical protein